MRQQQGQCGFKIQCPLRACGFKSLLWYLRLIVATRCGTSHKLRPARSLLRFLPHPPLPLCRRLQCRSMQINADRCELYGTIVGTSCHHCWHRLTRRFAQRGTPRHCMHGHVPTRPAPDARSFWSLQSLRRTCLAAAATTDDLGKTSTARAPTLMTFFVATTASVPSTRASLIARSGITGKWPGGNFLFGCTDPDLQLTTKHATRQY